MISKDFFATLEELDKANKLSKEEFLHALEVGIQSAYKRERGEARNIELRLNEEKNEIRIFAYKDIVEEVEDPDKQISLEDAKALKAGSKIGGRISEEVNPKDLSRIAIKTAMQVIQQKQNDVLKDKVYAEISSKKGEIVSAIVRRVENDTVYVELVGTRLEGVMLARDKVKTETYRIGQLIKVLVKEIRTTNRGVQVLVSRSAPEFVQKLFEAEVPEIRTGSVVIKNIVREAGERTKLSVYTDQRDFDPVGALIGAKSARISAVIGELGGEKVDIIKWNADPADYIQGALSPAKVVMITIDEDEKACTVVIADDKKSLAIGKHGQNVRLAARLTEYKIDIKSQSEYDEEFKESYSQSRLMQDAITDGQDE